VDKHKSVAVGARKRHNMRRLRRKKNATIARAHHKLCRALRLHRSAQSQRVVVLDWPAVIWHHKVTAVVVGVTVIALSLDFVIFTVGMFAETVMCVVVAIGVNVV
jgi:hypothetical protein